MNVETRRKTMVQKEKAIEHAALLDLRAGDEGSEEDEKDEEDED